MTPASIAYSAFVVAAATIAAFERLVALRHETRLLAEGGEEIAPWVLRLMAPPYILIFPAAIAEHLLLRRHPAPALVVAMVGLFAAAKGLKLWAVRALGPLWTMKVVLPRVPRLVTAGPYRFVRHPNYVAVMLEVLALPLAGGAWWTAAVGGASFALLLAFRIRSEEAALLARAGYGEAMASKARFIPRARS
jgi:methyltransferase